MSRSITDTHYDQPYPAPRTAALARADSLFQENRQNYDLPSPQVCAQRLAAFGGPEAIYQHMAAGNMINDVPLSLDIPIMWFEDWQRENLDPLRVDAALKRCSESLLLKAQMVLQVEAANAQDAAQARALAAEYRRLAESLDHERWGAKKSDSLSGMAVNIQMNFGDPTAVPAGGVAVVGESPPAAAAPNGAEKVELLPPLMTFETSDLRDERIATAQTKPVLRVPSITVPKVTDPF